MPTQQLLLLNQIQVQQIMEVLTAQQIGLGIIAHQQMVHGHHMVLQIHRVAAIVIRPMLVHLHAQPAIVLQGVTAVMVDRDLATAVATVEEAEVLIAGGVATVVEAAIAVEDTGNCILFNI